MYIKEYHFLPDFLMAKQRIIKWQNGFAVAALMAVLMFFIKNRQFHSEEEHQTFAGNMLYHNRFLFNNNDGDDYTVVV